MAIQKYLERPLVSIGLTLALLGCLYGRYVSQTNTAEVSLAFVQHMQGSNALWCWIALLLMPVNWWAEAQKWYPYVRKFEPISQFKALKAIGAGITAALFIPYNIGEWGGRACFLQPENRWKSAFIQGLGSLAQLLVLGSMGLMSAWYIAVQKSILAPDETMPVLILVCAIILVGTIFYFQVPRLIPGLYKLKKFRFFQTFSKNLTVIALLPPAALRWILFWSIFRCGIYATQYICLAYFFGMEVGILAAYSAVFTVFLVQTCLPIPALAGLMFRGNIALSVWGLWGANEISILSATAVLWIINLLFPAFLATFSFLFVKQRKTYLHENELA